MPLIGVPRSRHPCTSAGETSSHADTQRVCLPLQFVGLGISPPNSQGVATPDGLRWRRQDAPGRPAFDATAPFAAWVALH